MSSRDHPAEADRARRAAADRVTAGTYLVPVVDEVPALLGAAERVLVACGRAEDEWADRAVRVAAAVDPCTVQPYAVLGPGLPVPLGGRVASRALQRLAVALRPALVPGRADRWTVPGLERGVVSFRAVRIDTTDLAILGQAAARVVLPHRSGALSAAIASLGAGSSEPPDDRHPAALGCLLAALVPVVDPASRALHTVAGGDGGGLDDAALAAHREVGRRVLARLHRAR